MVFNDYANRRRSQKLDRWAMGEERKYDPRENEPKNFGEAFIGFVFGALLLSFFGYPLGSVIFGEPGETASEFVHSDFGGFLGIMAAVVLAYLLCRENLTKQY